MRTFLMALLATAALPAAALAQDDEARTGVRADLRLRADTDVQPEQRGGWRTDRAERAERAEPPARSADVPPGPQRSWNNDGERGRRFDRGPAVQPAAAQAQPAPTVQDQPRGRDRRGWGGDGARIDGRADARIDGRADRARDAGRPDWNRGNWNGADRNRDARPDWNRDGRERRDWDRNNDGRPDWNRGDDRRDWNRGDDRRDWNRGDDRRDWNRNDRRGNDWNRGGWNDDRRDFRRWDRGWRNNSRYDWQRYRSSNRYAFRLPRYAAPYGWNYGYRRQSIGAYLFAGLFARDYWIADPWAYRLPPVYWPYQWVRYYDDALLVDTRSGYVVDVIPGIFWY